MGKRIVLDATAFLESDAIGEMGHDADILTVPEVVGEVRSSRAIIFELAPIKVMSPAKNFLSKAEGAARATGDSLSKTDEKVIALALQEGAAVVSDDYGVQNVCRHLGIEFLPMSRAGIRAEWQYSYKCRGCGRIFDRETKVCVFCGHEVRKVRKKAERTI